VQAAEFLENVGVALADEVINQPRSFAAEPGFNPRDHLLPGEELNWAALADARSLAEMGSIRREIATEKMLRQRLGDGPLPELLATTLAVLSDPVTYIPFFGQFKAATTLGRTALSVALRSGAEVAVSELALQGVQQTRTAQESAIAIMLGGAFGAGLGTAAAGIARAGVRETAREAAVYKQAVEDFSTYAGIRPGAGATSAGAQAVPVRDPELLKLVSSGQVAETLAKLGKVGLAPVGLELAASDFAAVRTAVSQIVDVGVLTDGVVRGFAAETPVHIMIARHEAVDVAMGRTLQTLWREHASAAGRTAMSFKVWREVVGRAMRRADLYPEASVAKAAAEMRKVVEFYKEQAVGLGLLEKDVDVKTADSYFTRVYDLEKIQARPGEFDAIVAAYLRTNIKDAEPGEYATMARDVRDTIMGTPAGRVPFVNTPKLRGPMKERTFNIPDEWVEPFLVHDVRDVMSRFIRTMSSDIEVRRKFGDVNPGGRLAQAVINEQAERVSKPKKDGTAYTEAEKSALYDKAVVEGQKIKELLNRVRGVGMPSDPAYSGLKSAGKIVRDWNLVSLLGNMAPASVADLGQIKAREGFFRTFGALTADFATGVKGIRMGLKEAQLAGEAVDMTRSSRIRSLMDRGAAYEAQNAAERISDATASTFADLTGINLWNTFTKSVTSMMATTRILKTVEKIAAGKELSRREQFALRMSYIDDDMARRIAAQADKWERHAHVTIANTEAWDDLGAVDAMRNALVADIRRTIITPGPGDAPLWTSTEWGKTVFQFKRFSSAATTRILVMNLQARDSTAFAGIVTMIGMGALSQMLRDIASDGQVQDRTAREWAVNAVDRSGVLGLLMEGDSLLGKAGVWSTLSKPLPTSMEFQSLAQLAGGTEPTRFVGRGSLAQALGPTAGKIEEISAALAGIGAGNLTAADLHKVRRLVPGQNLFYLQWLFDQAERKTAEGLGLQARQR
jgi:hypothetical protein